MLLVFAFAALALSRAEVDIITSPGPGNQYVRLQTGQQKDIKNISEPIVQIKDEGLTGVQHKYPVKKAENVPLKKDFVGLKAVVKDEGASGVLKKQAGNGVPPQKQLPYDVVSSQKTDDSGGLDFEDDFHPLNKKKLVPAGTSQTSRFNVKKGPNGQDYEYEYVYYYYDEDEDEGDSTTQKAKHSEDRNANKKKEERIDPVVHETRSRQEVVEEEPRRRSEQRSDDRSRNRYTTIERGRTNVATTTEQINELAPRGQRTRGRHVEAVDEERLPANTRFPSRGRNAQAQTTQTPHTEIPSRSRTGGNIRRPSLVDSSSFRTHSSDVAPEADQGKYYTRGSDLPQNTRESDLEEYVDTVRPTTFSPALTSTVKYHPIPPLPEPTDISMPDKAAHDLYAILQQTQEENYVSPGDEEVTTEVPTTTTTTTEPTTTPTTTTTTTTTQAPQLPGRGRFRGANNVRSRPRPNYGSTTHAPETPKETTEEAPKRSKFQPTRNQPSSYSRRGSTRSSTTQAPQEESTQKPKSSFSANRYRSRNRQPHEEEKAESTTQAATSARPTRPRLNISGARPLRPGPRLNLRGKANPPAAVTPQTSAAPEEPAPTQPHQEEVVETTPAAPPAPQDALSRLRNRPRLRVSPRPHAQPAVEPSSPAPVVEAAPQEEPSDEQPTSTTESSKPSHLLRRRPNIRRLTLPHSQPQPQQTR